MCTKWTSPLLKQCFVTSGVTINYMAHGLVIGYNSVFIPALKASTEIQVGDDSATWIASVFGISLIFGAIAVPLVMSKFGRKPAHLLSAALMAAGWLTISVSKSVASLLFGRILQGLSMGFLADLGSVLIGEYCSPKNRGVLLASINLLVMIGATSINALGAFFTWRELSTMCGVVAFLDLVLIVCSPESPSYLAYCGKYDECRDTFHWLRGHGEDDELEKMIKSNIARKKYADKPKNGANSILKFSAYVKNKLSKKEVFKPILITLHLYAMNQWAGGITYFSYPAEVLDALIGKDFSPVMVSSSINILALVSCVAGLIIVKHLRRKLMLFVAMSLNIFSYLGIVLYVYLKTHSLLSFDRSLIGIILLHLQMMSGYAGSSILSNIIPGEIFPLEHRGFCAMFGILFFSINETINLKTAPYLFSSIGLHGAYLIYVSIVTYCFLVAWLMLPETKDRTLIDIEMEFRGKTLSTEDLSRVENLMENHQE